MVRLLKKFKLRKTTLALLATITLLIALSYFYLFSQSNEQEFISETINISIADDALDLNQEEIQSKTNNLLHNEPINKENLIQEAQENENIDEYLADIYHKINVQSKEIIFLKEKISTLEKQSLKNNITQNSSNLGLLFAEIIKIEKIAARGKNFSARVQKAKILIGNIDILKEKFLSLELIGSLATKTDLLTSLQVVENYLAKQKSNKTEKAFSKYITIKKIKNFTENSNNDFLNKITNAIKISSYQQAADFLEKLKAQADLPDNITETLQENLLKNIKFTALIASIEDIILNYE